MIHLVVPMLQHGGVYDFACKLRVALGEDKAILVHLSEHNVHKWEIGSNDAVFLQLSGYGFAKRGAPLWLLHTLEVRRTHIKTLGVFFHEIYGFGPPWTSAFWLSPVQRYVSRRIAELSDFWITSREGSGVWLRRYAGVKPHAVLPVFSTIGESDALPATRLPRLVVFGSAGLRRAAYEAAGNNLFSWAKRAAIEIHDIGSPIPDVIMAETLYKNSVVVHGRLEDEEIRGLMRHAEYGLLAYPIEYVAKSSVFAAYCAHGMCPVLISAAYEPADGLTAGTHYLAGPHYIGELSKSTQIGRAAREWYMPHDLQNYVVLLNSILRTSNYKAIP